MVRYDPYTDRFIVDGNASMLSCPNCGAIIEAEGKE